MSQPISTNKPTMISKTTTLVLGIALSSSALCHAAEPPGGPHLQPKQPPAVAPGAKGDLSGSASGLPEDAKLTIPVLKAVVILGNQSQLQPQGVKGAQGVVVQGVDFLKGKDFESVIAPHLGKPAKLSDLRQIQKDIIRYCQQSRDHLLVDVWFPEQTIEDGVVQMIVVEGKVNKVTVANEGAKYFSDEQVRGDFRLQPGKTPSLAQLNQDLTWANRNPFFCQVDASFNAAPDGAENPDLVLRVKDRFPVRVFAGYEDSGNKLIGTDRVLGGFNYGNVFGLGHQLNYQFMADTSFDRLRAHSASYVLPLPWRHTLTAFGTYADTKADLSLIGAAPMELKGTYEEAGLQYQFGLPSWGKLDQHFGLGFDYKRTDNSLLFGGVPVFKQPVEVAQFVAEYGLTLPDPLGVNSATLSGYFSPGDITGDNNDARFNANRFGADSTYMYGRLRLTRQTPLFAGFSWVVRFTGQISDSRLVPTEQLGLGGYDTVRGYDERVANGDQGLIVNNEIYTPPISLGLAKVFGYNPSASNWPQPARFDTLQFLGFYDYGLVRSKDFQSSYDPANATLSSIGGGVRFNLHNNLSVRCDYGYQLPDRRWGYETHRSRVHVGVTASF